MTPLKPDLSEADDEAEDELPFDPSDPEFAEAAAHLTRLRGLANAIGQAMLFARCGERFDADDLAIARDYLDALGFPDADPIRLGNWADAADAAVSLDRDPEGWEAEEMARAALSEAAFEILDPQALEVGLTLVAERIAAAAKRGLELVRTVRRVTDEELLAAAAGAAAQAAHGAALATIVGATADPGEPPHPFLLRLRLFTRGRWPVGLAGRTYNIL